MSNLKYKSSTATNSSATAAGTASNQPIWCSLTTPSQIARKYASIAPIWCHISRPRQLKKKFASTLHQAQNLLTRQHSRENTIGLGANGISSSGGVGSHHHANLLNGSSNGYVVASGFMFSSV